MPAKLLFPNVLGALVAVSVAAFAGAALAEEPFLSEAIPGDSFASEPIYSMSIFWSTDLYEEGFGVDGGFVYAFNKNISTTGWVLSGTGGYGKDDDAHSVNSSTSYTGSLMLGYQWQTPTVYATVFAGLNYVDNHEKPYDPTSRSAGSELGAIAQIGLETKQTNALYGEVSAAYSTAHDRAYGRLRTGYKTSGIKFGPELVAFREEGSDPAYRYGAFIGDIPLGRMSLTVSAGYADETGPGANDGAYGLIEFSMPLGRQ